MSDIPINVELGEHGLYYGTSPAMKGLLVTGESVEQVMDRVPYAIAEMHAAAEISRLKEELEEARASASAVRKAVLEEAIEAANYEAQFFDANGKIAAKRIVSVLQRLIDVSCNQQAQVDQSVSAQAPLQSGADREAFMLSLIESLIRGHTGIEDRELDFIASSNNRYARGTRITSNDALAIIAARNLLQQSTKAGLKSAESATPSSPQADIQHDT